MKEVKEEVLVKMPPLVHDASIIKVQTIKRKYVDQIRQYSEAEFLEELKTDFDFQTKTMIIDPWSTVRILGRTGYMILFFYKRGPDPTRILGKVNSLDFTSIFRRKRYDAEGIEWPLNDTTRPKVEKIDQEVWEEMERLPQIFED